MGFPEISMRPELPGRKALPGPSSRTRTVSYLQSRRSGRVNSVSQRSLPFSKAGGRVFAGFFQSRVVRVLALGAGAALFLALGGTPLAHLASAVHVSTLAMRIILGLSGGTIVMLGYGKVNKAEIEFELSAFNRLLKNKENTHEIPLQNLPFVKDMGDLQQKHLYLSSLPNALNVDSFLSYLPEDRSTVVSVNEPWEIEEARGLSVPLSQETWETLGVDQVIFKAEDHKALSPTDMNILADGIAGSLEEEGAHTLVHCRAGVGRSSTAIAAFLMKYTTMSIEEIAAHIKQHRPKATIWNKLHALQAYDVHLKEQGLRLALPVSNEVQESAEFLRKREAEGKKAKLSKSQIDKIERAKCITVPYPLSKQDFYEGDPTFY